MRVFIGIRPPETVIDALESGFNPYVNLGTPIRWVNGKNIHLTLKFIGDVESQTLDRLQAALLDLGREIHPFPLNIGGLGHFGRGRDLRIFWAGVTNSPALTLLHGKIDSLLDRFHIPTDTRPFNPHITLGRNKRNHDFTRLIDRLKSDRDVPFGEFAVTSFSLYNSRLTPDGPIYTVIKEIKLGHQ